MNKFLSASKIITDQKLDSKIFNRWISCVDASPKTIETYGKSIKQFWTYLQTNGITQPKREDILIYREYLKSNYKPTTVHNYLAAVKLFFRWTSRENLYPNVADRVKGAKIDTEHKKDYLTKKQVKDVIKTIDRSTLKGKRDYAIILVMVTTGLRTISIVNANIEDIRTVGDSTALYYRGKGHQEKATYVKLAEPVEDAIRDYLAARGKPKGNGPLFSSTAHKNSGERMTTRSLRRVVKQNLINANLISDRLTAHSFRHTAATLNLLNGGTMEETQQLLDHSNLNTTLIYSHALDRAKNNSENRIANAIFD